MIAERGGIRRLAPLLLVSLLLHLAAFIVMFGIVDREIAEEHAAPRLTVAYIEPPGSRENRPEPTPLPVPTGQTKSRPVMQPTPLPVTKPTQRPPSPPEQQEARRHPEAKPPKPTPSPPARSGQEGGSPVPKIAPLSPGGNGGAEMTVGTYSGSGKGSGAGEGPGTGTGHHGSGTGGSHGEGTASSASAGASQQRRATYQALLKRLIEARKEYPFAARRARQEGSCWRRFTISRSGALKKVESLSSCGYEYLDEAATRAITAVGKFPPLPDEIKGGEATFSVPIKFTLSEE